MGVYIKGMEMPTRCYTCPCADLEYYDCNLMPGTRIEQHKRLGNCPLVPVPPHGRLIDADELKALVRANIALFDSAPGRMGAEQKLVRAWLASMADDIEDAPTIIEAEEGE